MHDALGISGPAATLVHRSLRAAEAELAHAREALEAAAGEPAGAGRPAVELAPAAAAAAAVAAGAGGWRALGLQCAELAAGRGAGRVVCDGGEVHAVACAPPRQCPAGGAVRVVPQLPVRFLLAGGGAVVPLAGHAALVVREPALLAALAFAWETAWEQGVPVPPRGTALGPAARAPVPTPHERQLLALMAAGLKDEAVAARLAISRRSMTRRVGGLMRKLGARNRFQLGYLVARRGWMDADGEPAAGGRG